MAIPAAVQKQVDQAEALQAQLYTVEEQASAEAEQTAPEEVVAETPSNVVELPRQAEPAQVETPKPVEASDAEKYWKQKFDSLQGKFNAEVPQLYQKLKEQETALAKLTEQVQTRAETPTPDDNTRDSKDVEDYGADLVDMVNRKAESIARKAVAAEIAKLRGEFGAVQEQVGQVSNQVYQSESDKFWTGVMNLVPDWKQIDADPNWIAWLDTTPEFAEDTYRELASKAIAKGDAQKIANLVTKWRGPQEAAPQAPVQPSQAQAELRRQVAPSTAKSSNPPPQGGKVWSMAEYEAAMDVRNVRRLGQKEADRLEAEANLAVAEGRVRW